jgi:hypothetical protein
MYRFVDTEEVIPTDIFVTDISRYIRPLRDIDDLTDEELVKEWDKVDDSVIQQTGDKTSHMGLWLRLFLKRIEEFRSRPKETEKERWIRETHDRCKKIPSQWDFNEELSKTWNAAYEAGRKAK